MAKTSKTDVPVLTISPVTPLVLTAETELVPEDPEVLIAPVVDFKPRITDGGD